MELKVLEQTKERLKIELIGEDNTLSNALRKELWLDPHIKIAGYNIEHSLVSNPILVIETDGSENPKKALLSAIENIRKRNKDLLAEFNKAMK
ncbi:MAG: DNA-directed RNA polymerase subunit L [Nanoarchaeota archaeon]